MTSRHLLLDSRAERRESNFELLRIVAISMVLVYHFFFHGGPLKSAIGYRLAFSFLIYGVNLFVLVSGWFSIRTTWKSLIRLWMYVLFFFLAMSAGILCISLSGNYPPPPPISVSDWLLAFLAPFSHSGLWFLSVYFILMILAPLLNRAICGMSPHNLRIVILALSFIEFYSCFLFGNVADRHGYSLFNFIYLYLLGRYLNREAWISKIPSKMLLFGTLAAIAFFVALDYCYFITPELRPYDSFMARLNNYSSPKVVLISAAVLLLFSRWHFRSKWVNSIASAALGCYILQDGILRNVWYDAQTTLFESQPLHSWHLEWAQTCVVLYFGFWSVSWLLTAASRLFLPELSSALARRIPSCLKFRNEN